MKKTSHSADQKEKKNKPRVGEIFETDVITMDSEGYGMAVYQDIPVLVSGILPGEQARVKIIHVGHRKIFVSVVKIIRPALSRLKSSPCSKAVFCDGCPLISMSYPDQLAWKQGQVSREFARYKSLSGTPVSQILPSPRQLNYRNSARLVVSGKFSDPVIGIYRRNSHDVIDVGDCPLHHPLINNVVQAVKEGIRKGKVPIYSVRTDSGILRYLVVRISESENRAMVVFVTARRSFNEIHHLAKHLKGTVPEVGVMVQNVNCSAGNNIFGERDYFITPKKELRETIGNIIFSISPRSFFQINTGGARLIYEKVHELGQLTGRETVIDLYCGIGGVSLFLAREAHRVFGIESADSAVADAGRNALLNGIRNCSFEAGDAAELLEEFRHKSSKVDLIILNPPRKGCDEEVLKDAALLAPSRIIYVSCSPNTLARDLDILDRLGYNTSAVQPVDMFPQTSHLENIALLEPKQIPSAIQGNNPDKKTFAL